MKKSSSLKLKCNILFRKMILNLILFVIAPTNKVAIMLSQNLDKHIALQQKELFKEICIKSVEAIS